MPSLIADGRGSTPAWYDSTLELFARWTVFTSPLAHVVSLHDEKVGRLCGCVLCISQDGTIAVIALDGYQLYVIFISPRQVWLMPGVACIWSLLLPRLYSGYVSVKTT